MRGVKNCPCKGKERDLYGKKAQMESGAHECAVSGSGRFSAHEAHHGPEHRALGAVVLACAAVQLIRYFVVERGVFQSQLTLISGIICLALGAFLILRSDIVVSILPIVFGLFVIFDSISRVQNALDLRRCGYSSWKSFLLLPVLSVVLGVIMILNPFGTMETLVMAIGIILIVEGSINLLSALYTVLAVRRFAKLHPETQSMLESLTGEDLNGDGVVAPDVTRTDAEASAVELDEVDESATVEQENEK